MDRIAKEKVVSDLTKKFDESNFFILTHNNGLSVHEITSLRDKLREAGSTFKVVKNSLAKIAVTTVGANNIIQPATDGQTYYVYVKHTGVDASGSAVTTTLNIELITSLTSLFPKFSFTNKLNVLSLVFFALGVQILFCKYFFAQLQS